jgi:hypothetical protein
MIFVLSESQLIVKNDKINDMNNINFNCIIYALQRLAKRCTYQI